MIWLLWLILRTHNSQHGQQKHQQLWFDYYGLFCALTTANINTGNYDLTIMVYSAHSQRPTETPEIIICVLWIILRTHNGQKKHRQLKFDHYGLFCAVTMAKRNTCYYNLSLLFNYSLFSTILHIFNSKHNQICHNNNSWTYNNIQALVHSDIISFWHLYSLEPSASLLVPEWYSPFSYQRDK